MATNRDKKIGILGGTFDPIHIGHIIMAQDALELFELDSVVFLISGDPPHKKDRNISDVRHRLPMLIDSIAYNDLFKYELHEVTDEATGYTYDTIMALKEEFPRWDIHFIIGSDTLTELHTWHRIHDLLKIVKFITIDRPDYPAYQIDPKQLNLMIPWPMMLLKNVKKGHAVGISSTDIRKRVAEGQPVVNMVPQAALEYIYDNGMYIVDEAKLRALDDAPVS